MVDQLAPTPWTKDGFAIYDANKQWVLAVMIYLDEDSRPRAIEIRDRVTAAVNATADISKEALENGVLKELFEQFDIFIEQFIDTNTGPLDTNGNAARFHLLESEGAEAPGLTMFPVPIIRLLAQLTEVTPSTSQRKC